MKTILFASIFFVSSAFAKTHMLPTSAVTLSTVSQNTAFHPAYPDSSESEVAMLALDPPDPPNLDPNDPGVPTPTLDPPWPDPTSPNEP